MQESMSTVKYNVTMKDIILEMADGSQTGKRTSGKTGERASCKIGGGWESDTRSAVDGKGPHGQRQTSSRVRSVA